MAALLEHCPSADLSCGSLYRVITFCGSRPLLLPDGGIVYMIVRAQKWELNKSEAPTSRTLARKCVGSSSPALLPCVTSHVTVHAASHHICIAPRKKPCIKQGSITQNYEFLRCGSNTQFGGAFGVCDFAVVLLSEIVQVTMSSCSNAGT